MHHDGVSLKILIIDDVTLTSHVYTDGIKDLDDVTTASHVSTRTLLSSLQLGVSFVTSRNVTHE